MQYIKYIILVMVVAICGMSSIRGLWSLANWMSDRTEHELTQQKIECAARSEIAQVGIDAGINACLTFGRMRPQMSERELNELKSRARRLMDMLYPEQKFQWPTLKERGITGRVPEA